MKNKVGIGFFIMCLAVITGVVSIALYGNAYATSKSAYGYLIAAVVVAAIAAAGSLKMPRFFSWGAPIAAALAAAAIAYSATVMADPIGYVISGLYDSSTLTGYIRFCIAIVITWLLYLVVGFMGMARKK